MNVSPALYNGRMIRTEDDIDPVLLEWLYAFESLRALGFTPDDLYFVVLKRGGLLQDGERVVTINRPVVQLELRAQGLQWRWTLGCPDLPLDQIQPSYEAAAAFWNAHTTDAASLARYHRSRIFAMRVDLVLSLKAKGFVFPSITN